MNAVATIERQRVVPVIRCSTAGDAELTARAAAAAGFDLVELTLTTPGVLEIVPALVDDGLTVAIGTVTSVGEVRAAAASGASLVISFACPEGFIETAAAERVPAIPGAFTPSEILAAYQAGANVVKLFPARSAGAAMVGDIRAVLPGLRLLPTGGLPSAAVPEWLAAGALAVGLGSCLGTVSEVGRDEVMRRCREAKHLAAAAH